MIKKIQNLSALAAIQGANAFLPLLVFPYVLGAVGSEHYAQIVVAEAIVIFLMIIVLYSFEIDGVIRVASAAQSESTESLALLFGRVLQARLWLFVFLAPVFLLACYLFRPDLLLLVVAWMLVPLGCVFQPTWFFQGLQANTPLAVIVLSSRALAVTAVFCGVSGPEDYLLPPLIIGISYLLSGVGSAGFAMWRYQLRFPLFEPRVIRAELVGGRYIFFGNLGVALYRDSNVLLLSLFQIPAVGIAAYSMAEKIVKAIQACIRPLNQFFFPQAVHMLQGGVSPSRRALKGLVKMALPQVAALLLLIGGLAVAYFWLGPLMNLSELLDGAAYIAMLVGLMSAAAVFGVGNFMVGSVGLNTLGQRQYLFRATLLSGGISLIVTIVLCQFLQEKGAALGFVAAEFLLLCLVTFRYLSFEADEGSAG